MFYIIQNNLFREEGHQKLINALDKFKIDYELVNVLPFVEDVEFKTKRKDVFVFGSLKLARLSKNTNWFPGALITDNHDYNIYSKYYKDNLLNYDSRVVNFEDDFEWIFEEQFIRPCLDTKSFNGKIYDQNTWLEFKKRMLDNPNDTTIRKNTQIQVAKPKKITQEVRFWIVDGKIITQSTYRRGSFLVYDNIVDNDAIEFAQSMVNIFQIAKCFVIDVCLSNDVWKIVECGSISCAGFYDADMQKIIIALEDSYI